MGYDENLYKPYEERSGESDRFSDWFMRNRETLKEQYEEATGMEAEENLTDLEEYAYTLWQNIGED